MSYSFSYHPKVKQDFLEIDPVLSTMIQKTMIEKLSSYPLHYGEYLHGQLHPYRKLRVGDYRIVYRVYEKKIVVYVIAVGNRRDDEVYEKALQRVGMKN